MRTTSRKIATIGIVGLVVGDLDVDGGVQLGGITPQTGRPQIEVAPQLLEFGDLGRRFDLTGDDLERLAFERHHHSVDVADPDFDQPFAGLDFLRWRWLR